MAYVALYRKWRPDCFEEVKGQEHIVTTLKNQVKHDRIGHAYIFCGTRGTGKTTLAKLMAKTVNCENPVDGSPCNKCPSCISISNGTAMNVMEIDAASNNGVDNIRQINESVQYSPTQGKYLVYIIDEVHMLSSGAFNALLKTLEEPPSYAMFILATTESHKIPITIMSRCQRYDFRRISLETITDRLDELLKREGITATREALNYVAKAADGSMRDALSILEQCISFNLGEELTFDRVLNTIGAVDIDVYLRMMDAISEDDMVRVMANIEEVVWQGRDLSQFITDFIWFIRNMLFIKIAPDVSRSLEMTSENVEKVQAMSEYFSEEALVRYLNVLKDASNDIKYSTVKRVSLEMAIIRMCRPETDVDFYSVCDRLDKLQKTTDDLSSRAAAGTLVSGGLVNDVETSGLEKKQELSEEERRRVILKDLEEKKYTEADRETIENIVSNWKNTILPMMSPRHRTQLSRVSVTPGNEPGSLDIIVNKSLSSADFTVQSLKSSVTDIIAVIAEVTERDVKINIKALTEEEIRRTKVPAIDFNKIAWPGLGVI